MPSLFTTRAALVSSRCVTYQAWVVLVVPASCRAGMEAPAHDDIHVLLRRLRLALGDGECHAEGVDVDPEAGVGAGNDNVPSLLQTWRQVGTQGRLALVDLQPAPSANPGTS